MGNEEMLVMAKPSGRETVRRTVLQPYRGAWARIVKLFAAAWRISEPSRLIKQGYSKWITSYCWQDAGRETVRRTVLQSSAVLSRGGKMPAALWLQPWGLYMRLVGCMSLNTNNSAFTRV